MIIAILAAAAVQGNLVKEVIGTPTGKNGYEELVAASQVLVDRKFGIFRQLEARSEEVRTPENQDLYDVLQGKTLLQKRRWASERFRPALDLLLAASQKPIADPRTKVDITVLFPELVYFKELSRLIALASYAAFADGKADRALTYWTAGFDCFDRTSGNTLIQFLVGVSCTTILLASVEEQLPRLSEADARKLEAVSKTLLEREPMIIAAMDGEFKFCAQGLQTFGTDDSSWNAFDGVDYVKLQEEWKALPETDRIRVREIAMQRLAALRTATLTRLSGPEHEWVESADPFPQRPSNSLEKMADSILDFSLPIFEAVNISAVRIRTQIRLMGVCAGVVRYRWEHNRFPTTVEEAVGKERAMDPLSQQNFEIRREGTGGFSVVSKGVKQTGEIALRYRRPTGQQPIDP